MPEEAPVINAVPASSATISPHLPIAGRRASGVSGLVTATIDEPRGGKANQVLCCCDGILPLRRRFGSKGPLRGPRDEVALKIKRVVGGDMDAEEALGGSS